MRTHVGNLNAFINNETQARVGADGALSSSIDYLVAQTNSDRAYLLASEQARVGAEGALSTRLDGLGARVGNNEGTISQVSSALSSTVQVQAGTNIDLYARSDAGTAYGRIKFEAVSAPAGVAVRFSIQLSTERNGFYRNSGLFMDILGDGSSRIVMDANLIAFTANGGLSYPFTFDGQTLRVPNLILTSGQASNPLRIDIGSYTLIAGQGTVNDQIDANLNFTFNVSNPDFPSTLELFGKVTVTGPQGTELRGIRLLLDGQIVGYVRFNEQITTPITSGPANNTFDFRCSCIRYLSVGAHRVQIQYSYTSPGAGQVQINELHVAGFTPRA